MAKNWLVYCHEFPNGKKYIGITSNYNTRVRNGKGYDTQPKVARAIKKYGWDSIQHSIIVDGLTKEQAGNIEKYLIASLDTINNGYNVSVGGENINSCYLDEYILAMLRYAKTHNITHNLLFADGKKIDIVNLVDLDRYDKRASEMWNEAGEAVKRKHGLYSATNMRDVMEFWWYMLQYYNLWIMVQSNMDVSLWEEVSYERAVLDYLFEGDTLTE